MKIGFNPDRIPGNNYKFVLLRHVPVDPKVFDYYIKDGFPRFDVAPTWKRTSPHNIQRRTWQNVTCNNCHGQRDLYLSEDDLLDYEKKANFGLTVTDQQIPKKRARTMKLDTDLSGIMSSWVVDVNWLKENLGQDNLVILDARNEADYEKGHIPGAISLNPNMGEGLRKDPYSESPLHLEDPEILAETFGEYGIAIDDHVVVYCDKGQNGGFLLSILDYAGAENISLLNGGIAAWKKAGYEITDEETEYEEKTFEINVNQEFLADNDFVKANLDNPYAVIVDVRILQQSMGLVKHGLADRPGTIPGSVKLPVFALYEDHSGIKNPEELLWVLKERNIPKDKTIILTCNTGNWAGAAHFVFRYLGYPDVRVHDESWIGWKN
jgi:thiosulfate/3-mercaptopyruvate sulfurtransferase